MTSRFIHSFIASRWGRTAVLALLVSGSAIDAAEIRSNGGGGGKWSQAATWEENQVPGPGDTVVITGGDRVLFDRDDSSVISCASLQLDPDARFEVEAGAGKRVFRVGGLVEAYGAIRMDGSLSPEDHLEIQLAAGEGKLALHKGGALIISGYANLPEGRRNALIRATASSENAGSITADSGCAIDIKNAHFANVAIQFSSINNTGIRPNERLNLVDSRFEEASVAFIQCDTPQFLRNQMSGSKRFNDGLLINRTPLAEVKGNTISGYPTGIRVLLSELTLDGNTIEKVNEGINVAGGKVTIRGITIREAGTGIWCDDSKGSLQDGVIEKSARNLFFFRSTFQISNMVLDVPGAGGDAVQLEVRRSKLVVINSNLDPKHVKMTKTDGDRKDDGLTVMQYVVAKVTGKIPLNAHVAIEPGEKKGSAAPEAIRNSPAPVLPNGLTPFPRSMRALLVKSWEMGVDGKLTPAPGYRVSVIVPSSDGQAAPKEHKSVTVKPDEKWVRPDLDSQAPTLEISL